MRQHIYLNLLRNSALLPGLQATHTYNSCESIFALLVWPVDAAPALKPCCIEIDISYVYYQYLRFTNILLIFFRLRWQRSSATSIIRRRNVSLWSYDNEVSPKTHSSYVPVLTSFKSQMFQIATISLWIAYRTFSRVTLEKCMPDVGTLEYSMNYSKRAGD